MYNNTVSDQLKLAATLNNDLVTFSHAPRCVVKLVYFPHQASEECRTCVKRCGLSILQIVGAEYNLSTIHGHQTRILNIKCSSSRTQHYFCSLSPIVIVIVIVIVISAKSTNTTNTRYHVDSSVDEPHRLQQRVLVLVDI